MDSVSSPELAALFERVQDYVDLRGTTSAWEIESRIKRAVEACKTAVKIERAAVRPRKSRIKEFGYAAEQLDKLVEHGFPDRVLVEAQRYPRGIIARVLLYGKREARRRVLAHRRAAARAYPGPSYPGVRWRAGEIVKRRPRRQKEVNGR